MNFDSNYLVSQFDFILSRLKDLLKSIGVSGKASMHKHSGTVFIDGESGILIMYRSAVVNCYGKAADLKKPLVSSIVDDILKKLDKLNFSILRIDFSVDCKNFSAIEIVESKTNKNSYIIILN